MRSKLGESLKGKELGIFYTSIQQDGVKDHLPHCIICL